MLSDRVAHWEWVLRKRRAQVANAVGRPFTYRHPLLGRFVYHPSDDLSRNVLLYDFEAAEIRFAVQHAGRGGTILDVGANIGVFTAACARAAGARGKVIAIEPSPRAFEKLRVTCARLGLHNVQLLRIAAADATGRARFVAGGIHELRHHLADARDTAGTIQVETRRLDDVCGAELDRVMLVKIDVEGHEVSVLAGAERILSRRRASLIVEFYAAGLAAAGESPSALWTLLSRTHACLGIVAHDGSPRPPIQSSVAGDDPVNTLWEPC